MGRKKPGPGLDIQTMGSFQREENRDREGVESSGAVETSQRETRQGGSSTARETWGKARGQGEEQRSEAECCGTLELPERQNFLDHFLIFGGIGVLRLSVASLNIRPVLLPLFREAPFSWPPQPPLSSAGSPVSALLLQNCIPETCLWLCSYLMTCPASIFHSFFFFLLFFSFFYYFFLSSSSTSSFTCILSGIC